MAKVQMTFKRYELKYLMNEETYRALCDRLKGKMVVDNYGLTTICSLYFDTPDARLIRTSIEKPVYKEKLRIRSYNVPTQESTVYAELKKKYKGVVYKRREKMNLTSAMNYLCNGESPGFESQILREIDYFMSYYQNLKPAMFISYDRIAMKGIEDPLLRVTFDTDIRWRDDRLHLEDGVDGATILEPGQHLMEIKMVGAMPYWLGEILDELKIYPTSFSKYGRAYQAQQKKKEETKGGNNCA